MGNEFVFHVPDEYDYRYSHPEMREKIITYMDKLYQSYNGGSPMKIFFRDEISLDKYTVKKGDKKSG